MANSKPIEGSAPFQIEAHSFMISASGQGYTLGFSAVYSENDADYTQWGDAIPSGINLPVINCPRSCWWKCIGNTDILTAAY